MPAVGTFSLEALEGELLGDGSLFIGRRYTNAVFQLQARSRGQVLLAHAALHGLGGAPPRSFIRNSSGYRVTPVEMWQWRSERHQVLTAQYHRWYGTGARAVPPDFVLSPVAALHWFVGDGSLHPTQAKVTLCTDNFDELSIERLKEQLRSFGLAPYCSRTSKGFLRLNLSGTCCDTWFSIIGPCAVPEMEHKWAVVSRLYSTKRTTRVEVERIRSLRSVGHTYSSIAAEVGRSICTVWEAVNGRKPRATLDT